MFGFFKGVQVGAGLIAALVVLGFFGVLGLLVFHPVAVDSAMSDILKIMTGTLGAKFSDVVQYHFGSSSGSKSKDDILKGIVANDPSKAS